MSARHPTWPVALLAAWAASCGGSPEVLEVMASDCDERPPVTLGGLGPFVGVNAYYLQEEAARSIRAGRAESPEVEEVFRKARALGATVVRTWAFNDSPQKRGDSAIQPGRLEYDELSLRGLDLVLARASAHGLKLILPLSNSWDDYGGARQYVAWAGLPDPEEADPRFFTHREVIDHYREHLGRLLGRVNTADGLRYGDHPAVLAWELINEPRLRSPDDAAGLGAWIREISQEVKRLAPGHLVGTGEEGFELGLEGYDASFWREAAPALFQGGGDFRGSLAAPAVDYASIHLFPEGWGVRPERAAEVGARWIREHAALAHAAGKPLLLGEFGLRNQGAFDLPERRALYRGWLECARRAGVAGALPWMFAYDARPDAWDDHTFYFLEGKDAADPANRYADVLIEASR